MQNLLAILLLLPLLGCSSQLPVVSVPNSDEKEGTYYMLPRGKIHIRLYKQLDKDEFALEFVGMTLVPDKDFGYYVTHDQGFFASDKLVVDVTSDGLLDAIKLTTEDVTDQVIVKIVELAGRVVSGVFSLTPRGFVDQGTRAQYALLYEAEFDPFSELSNINNAICKRASSSKLTIHLEGISEDATPAAAESCKSEDATPAAAESCKSEDATPAERKFSVYYRPPVAIPLVFKENGDEIYRKDVVIPDIRSINGLKLERVMFEETITSVDFENGMLKQFAVTRPSQALAVADLPLELLRTLIAIPTELIQLKIDTSGKNKALYEAQREEIEAQEALIKKLEELRHKKDSETDP